MLRKEVIDVLQRIEEPPARARAARLHPACPASFLAAARAAGLERIVLVLGRDAPDVRDAVCALAGTPVTATEWGQYVPGAAYDPPCPAG